MLKHAGNIRRLLKGEEAKFGGQRRQSIQIGDFLLLVDISQIDDRRGPSRMVDGAMARTLSPAERLDWLQLARSGGVGPRTFFKLLQRFGSARRAFAELPRLAQEAGAEDRWQRCRRDEAEAELAALGEQGCRLIAHGEPDYPRHLAEIADPPPLLTVQGQVELLAAPGVALVGARNASANGRLLAKRLAGELAAAGLAVISGLARGIDTAAHEGALAAPGPTIAVIAAGIDIAYPADNAPLDGARSPRAASWSPSGRSAPSRRRATSRAATA